MSESVADKSGFELRRMIKEIVNEQLESRTVAHHQSLRRSVSEILEEMRANLWTPSANAKSSLELLREDRDR